MTVRSVSVPDEIRAVAADWHGGQASMLYAVASTGGLTPGRRDFSTWSEVDQADQMGALWWNLATELEEVDGLGREWVDTAWQNANAYCRLSEALEEQAGSWPEWAEHLRGEPMS